MIPDRVKDGFIALFNNQPYELNSVQVIPSTISNLRGTSVMVVNSIPIIVWNFEKSVLTIKSDKQHETPIGSILCKFRIKHLPFFTIHQKKNIWFLNGKEWDGSPKSIKVDKAVIKDFLEYIDDH